MVHITLNVTCYLLLFTSCFPCVYAGNSKNTAWLTMSNKCKGTLTLLSPYDSGMPSL